MGHMEVDLWTEFPFSALNLNEISEWQLSDTCSSYRVSLLIVWHSLFCGIQKKVFSTVFVHIVKVKRVQDNLFFMLFQNTFYVQQKKEKHKGLKQHDFWISFPFLKPCLHQQLSNWKSFIFSCIWQFLAVWVGVGSPMAWVCTSESCQKCNLSHLGTFCLIN